MPATSSEKRSTGAPDRRFYGIADVTVQVESDQFLALEHTVEEPAHPRPMPKPITEGVVFDGVSFQYPETTRTAIDAVSLHVKPGEVVALVGANGSGKTTLVKLLCRLYSPQAGTVTIDGIDLREFSTSDLRREVSVIFQDYATSSRRARTSGSATSTGPRTIPASWRRRDRPAPTKSSAASPPATTRCWASGSRRVRS